MYRPTTLLPSKHRVSSMISWISERKRFSLPKNRRPIYPMPRIKETNRKNKLQVNSAPRLNAWNNYLHNELLWVGVNIHNTFLRCKNNGYRKLKDINTLLATETFFYPNFKYFLRVNDKKFSNVIVLARILIVISFYFLRHCCDQVNSTNKQDIFRRPSMHDFDLWQDRQYRQSQLRSSVQTVKRKQ